MKKEREFEGYIFQDVDSARKPIYVLRDGARNTETLEKLLVAEGIIPTIAQTPRFWKADDVDYLAPRTSRFGTISKEFVRQNLKRVKVTITIEEV